MSWIQFSLILLLVPGFPLLQVDQVVNIDWIVCEDVYVQKLRNIDCGSAEGLVNNSRLSSIFPQFHFILKLKNPMSVLFSSFWGTLPFRRPPPRSLYFG